MSYLPRLAALLMMSATLASTTLLAPATHAQQPVPVTHTDTTYYVHTYLYPSTRPAPQLHLALPVFISLRQGITAAPWTDSWFIETYLAHSAQSITLPLESAS